MDVKAGIKGYALGRRDLLDMDPRTIEIEEGLNSRDFTMAENIEAGEQLKASIIKNGVKVPLTIRLNAGRIMLVDGERRLRAVRAAIEGGHDIKTVPCQVEERHTNDAERLVEQVIRNTGKPFSPLEMARHCKRLSAFGWLPAEIADKLSMSQSNVSHLFSLLAMPEEAQSMVRAGEVSASVALTTVREHGESNGVAVLRDASAEARERGKKRATTKTVNRAAARTGLTKKSAKSLNAVQTEKVVTFLRHFTMQRDEATLPQWQQKANELLDIILA
jgi:ParB family transcriptional regulator, chromosome partitioning protein